MTPPNTTDETADLTAAFAHLVDTPPWWRVRTGDINAQLGAAQRGSAWKLADTPGGHEAWAYAIGGERARPGTATWALGSNSRNVAAYHTRDDDRQVVALVCGVHGAETEAIAGAMNLIALLEDGRDLRGDTRPALVDLAEHYRLVIVPCLNMDGRAVSPDHLRGADDHAFRLASQGIWRDGSLIGYPACKQYAPLPLDRVAHPGGYPNADGYNIMHDVCPGDLRTAEAAALLKLIADEQADLILHMHSHPQGGQVHQSLLSYPLHETRIRSYQQRIHDALAQADLRPAPVPSPQTRLGVNLATATSIASGGLSVVFEQSCLDGWTFDESLETFYISLETFLQWGLREPFSPRHRVARGMTD